MFSKDVFLDKGTMDVDVFIFFFLKSLIFGQRTNGCEFFKKKFEAPYFLANVPKIKYYFKTPAFLVEYYFKVFSKDLNFYLYHVKRTKRPDVFFVLFIQKD